MLVVVAFWCWFVLMVVGIGHCGNGGLGFVDMALAVMKTTRM